MDQQTMQTYIEDLLEEREDLYAKIRLLEKQVKENEIDIKRLTWERQIIADFGRKS